MRIYLDLDGVLADFVTGSIRAHGRNETHDDVHVWAYPEKQWGMTWSDFWANCSSREFWAELPAYPWAGEVLSICQQFGDVYFLTAVSAVPGSVRYLDAVAGKAGWLARHMGAVAPTRMIPLAEKHLLARRDAVLIDDCPANIEQFAIGGWTVGFAQPWNEFRIKPSNLHSALFEVQELMEGF